MGTVLRAMTICDTPKMEVRYDLKSILTLLPLVIRSSSTTTPLLFWPSQVVEALKSLSQGPIHSNVSSGDSLFIAISDIRNSLSLSSHHLNRFAHEGYSLFFDELISRADSTKWFGEVIPAVANLLLQLPALLEMHYQNADKLLDGDKCGVKAGLRLLGAQAPGIVLLSQELIGALLACAFFCLFPVTARGAKDLPMINFDYLFGSLYETYSETQENKIKCIIHYFERICSCMPKGFVSFERKVLPLEQVSSHIPYPKTDFWSTSSTPLCPVEVCSSGLIEDQSSEALEVDFANEYLGGGALHRGCVQEEIRFMINPELIVGMLFLPRMEDNEAIEIIGAERFSNYRGYASSFCFAGDHKDKRSLDIFGRRKTRIIAIDALCSPRMRQFKLNYLLRETNKAFCGFFDQLKCDHNRRLCQDGKIQGTQCEEQKDDNFISRNNLLLDESPSAFGEVEMKEEESKNKVVRNPGECSWCLDNAERIGVATGNWGCGAFGGDPELKAIIQWLAASQASRSSVLYYTCGIKALQYLDQVSKWILAHEWTVGDLWNLLVEYSSQRLKGETKNGFFTWLLPSLTVCNDEMSE